MAILDELKKAYEDVDMFDTLGLPVSKEHIRAVKVLEKRYIETEILPLVKLDIESLFEGFRNKFSINMSYEPEKGLTFSTEKPKGAEIVQPDLFGNVQKQGRASQTVLRVILPDGNVIQEKDANRTFISCIQLAGIERVKQMGITLLNVPLISDFYEEKYKSHVRQVGDVYFAVFSDTRTKKRILEQISNVLKLGWKIETALKKDITNENMPRFRTGPSSKTMTVIFPDGTVIGPVSGNEAYVRSITKLGIENVYAIQCEIGGRTVVSKTAFRQGLGVSLGNGWHVYTNINNIDKRDNLIEIGRKMNIELDIQIKN